jgi:hypothetical protein
MQAIQARHARHRQAGKLTQAGRQAGKLTQAGRHAGEQVNSQARHRLVDKQAGNEAQER